MYCVVGNLYFSRYLLLIKMNPTKESPESPKIEVNIETLTDRFINRTRCFNGSLKINRCSQRSKHTVFTPILCGPLFFIPCSFIMRHPTGKSPMKNVRSALGGVLVLFLPPASLIFKRFYIISCVPPFPYKWKNEELEKLLICEVFNKRFLNIYVECNA